MTRNLELNAWHELVILGDVAAARKNAVLTIYDAESKPVARYHLENAWPAKIEIGALKAGASEVLMETVTIVCEHLQRVSV
jgi:phage tail-like protein